MWRHGNDQRIMFTISDGKPVPHPAIRHRVDEASERRAKAAGSIENKAPVDDCECRRNARSSPVVGDSHRLPVSIRRSGR